MKDAVRSDHRGRTSGSFWRISHKIAPLPQYTRREPEARIEVICRWSGGCCRWHGHGRKDAGEGLAGVGLLGARDKFGRALGDDAAAAFAALGAQVDDPVGLLDHVEVVLDDQHGIAERNQALQHIEEFAHVVEMQPGGRLVENVERAAGLALGKLAGQLDALGFAAGERRSRLTQLDIARDRLRPASQAFAESAECFPAALSASLAGRFRTSEIEWPLKRTASVSEL